MDRYQAENIRLKTLFFSGRWKGVEDAKNPRVDAIRLRFVDEYAASMLVQAWSEGIITWRWLWRVVSDFPGEFSEQVKLFDRKKS